MKLLIADSFPDSLIRLTGEERTQVKLAAFDLQLNPSQPGRQMHRIGISTDRNFWSARVNLDVRIVLHRTESSTLLCYVGHHDDAFEWARQRKLETHPRTGAAQMVEVRETVQEVVVPRFVKPPLFASTPEADLLACGVPPEWIPDVRRVDEDSLFDLTGRLPAEAAEALLELATGRKPVLKPGRGGDPFAHPDAQRRFQVIRNVEELERALDYPWDKWAVFLHPAQRALVEREYSGAARVAGSAGTGKTIVALHRAVHLTRTHSTARVLLTTFSDPLARALHGKLQRLIAGETGLAERIDVRAMGPLGIQLWKAQNGGSEPKLASAAEVRDAVLLAAAAVGKHTFNPRFLLSEWKDVVDAWQLASWESYRDVPRLGRRTRLPEGKRSVLWEIFRTVREKLAARGLLTEAGMFTQLAAQVAGSGAAPYEFAVVDEAQDVSPAQLRFLAALGQSRPDALFFAGDQGQRIFQQPFSWKSLGVDVRGRSTTLKVNYRTSHQIRMQADRLLSGDVTDADGNVEERKGTSSVFNGPPPAMIVSQTVEEEVSAVSGWLGQRLEEGLSASEIGIFVRSDAQVERAQAAAANAGLTACVLDSRLGTVAGHAVIGTMHLAKGLEFRAVAVMACDDEVIPSRERIETAADEAELKEVYDTERNLLYVACTRARDFLLVSGVKPLSEFLEDLAGSPAATAG